MPSHVQVAVLRTGLAGVQVAVRRTGLVRARSRHAASSTSFSRSVAVRRIEPSFGRSRFYASSAPVAVPAPVASLGLYAWQGSRMARKNHRGGRSSLDAAARGEPPRPVGLTLQEIRWVQNFVSWIGCLGTDKALLVLAFAEQCLATLRSTLVNSLPQTRAKSERRSPSSRSRSPSRTRRSKIKSESE